ncbi:hypothetical protein KAJ27_10275, partial [bacterium]|nr:hypothetical protein [bacterium]
CGLVGVVQLLKYSFHTSKKISLFSITKVSSFLNSFGENLIELANDADILITESSHPPGEQNPAIFHMTPKQAAETAKNANVKQLLLTHFSSPGYPEHSLRRKAENVAKNIFPNTKAMFDNDIVIV